MSVASHPAAADPHSWAGGEWPLGARVDSATSTTTFAVAAPDASRVLLEVYAAPTGTDAAAEFDLATAGDGVWRARVRGVGPGAHYGYRVWGPGWDVVDNWSRGNSAAGFVADIGPGGGRFNPNKVLTDPYAREISHSPASPAVNEAGADGGIFGWGPRDYRGTAVREWDTGRVAPKAIVVADDTATGLRPSVAAESTTVYEAHIRNLTQHPSAGHLRTHLAGLPGFEQVQDVPEALRGTYAGAAHLAPYLKALGFTAIELLPVHETSGSEPNTERSSNHWAYMTLGFFAPNRMYAADRSPGGPTREFKEMVAAFHAEGIEVFLDVVYNHTGEGGNWGDLDTVGFTGFGGFGTQHYYVLTDAGHLIDGATGTGNQTDLSSPVMQRLVIDSAGYWADEMGVDGFRFDLAPVLGRMPDDFAIRDDRQKRFFPGHPLLQALRDFGAARGIEMIAEAWDLWGYEVGNFPDGWAEWNGRFRDEVRSFLKGDGNTGPFCSMMNGDYHHFADQGGPQRSINFVTAHDGFTMLDLVAYDAKNNGDPWPFGPSDGGTDDNRSWGSGGDPVLRRQRLRNLWTVAFLSRGVPMVCSGDEYGRTQNGNNNPYNLNTIGMWNNWASVATNAPTAVQVDPDRPDLHYRDVFGRAAGPPDVNPMFVFSRYLAMLRRDHPGLRQRTYGDDELGGDEVSYLFTTPDGRDFPAATDRAVRLRINAATVGAADLFVLINMWISPVVFDLPDASRGRSWRRLVDTSAFFEAGFNCWSAYQADPIVGTYGVQPWSIVVLAEGPHVEGGVSPVDASAPPGASVISQVRDVLVEAMTSWFRGRSR